MDTYQSSGTKLRVRRALRTISSKYVPRPHVSPVVIYGIGPYDHVATVSSAF